MDKGGYVLVLELPIDKRIKIGDKGTFLFPRGTYCYVGRALKNLDERIKRHKRRDKKKHWHIDYLIQHAELLDVLVREGGVNVEHETVKKLEEAGGEHLVPGFGSSDCSKCTSHLLFFEDHLL